MYYSVDMLNQAINEHKRVEFQYYSYTPLKEKVLRHNGEYYSVSPHRLTWSNDSYYLLGHSSGRAGESVFRIDRILNLGFAKEPWIPPEEGFCIEEFINSSFLMYEGVFQKVVLQCYVSSMNNVVDKFGFDVETEYDPDTDAEHFIAKVNVCVSPTFYSWVFNYCGKIKILAPEPVVEGFSAMLKMHI
jgi:predicted DNA-binding transcriptional regulator YafY